jgi:2-phospho-L-lactate/phosphoenolpyruvate guanylyltransferase
MRTAAILPVKSFSRAKQRLGETVEDHLRVDLARAMVGDVLTALRECAAIEATIVVTSEPSVTTAARYMGATVVEDDAESGQSAAVSLGIDRALADGYERALCVPGDCPALDPGEVEGLLERAGAAVVIVPDRHGTGTNGLLLTPPDAIAPSFGAGSRERHERLASDAGLEYTVSRPASLLLDIDTGDDLAALRERLAGEHVAAPRTRAVLDSASPAGELWPKSQFAA